MDSRAMFVILIILQLKQYIIIGIQSSRYQEDVWRHPTGITTVRSNTQFKLSDEPSEQPDSSSNGSSTRATSSLEQEEVCDFNGEHLLVAVNPQPPLVNCFQNMYGYWICNGSNIEVLKVLEHTFNFEADWLVLTSSHLDSSVATSQRDHHHVSGKTVGEMGRDEKSEVNFTGVLGLVGSGRAFMSANGFMPTPERERSKILSEPFDSFKLHFLLSKTLRDHDHIFIKPFHLDAWIAILCSALLIVPVFYLINFTSAHYTLRVDRKLSRLSIWDCFSHMVGKGLGSKVGHLTRKRSSSSSSLSDDALYKLAISTQVLVLQSYSEANDEKRKKLRRQRRVWAAERRKARRIDKATRKSGFFNIAYIIWYVAGSLTTQGGETEDLPHASSTRILVAFWWLYLIVITSIHSGILTAILTFPRQNDFIQTLDDFMALNVNERGYMKVTLDRHSELANLFSNPDNLHKSPLRQLLVPSAKPSGELATASNGTAGSGSSRLTATLTDGVQADEKGQLIVEVDFQRHRQRVLDDVLHGLSAYIEEKAFIDQIITQEYFDHRIPRCLFKSSRFPVDTIPMSLALSPKMPPICLNSINNLLRHIMRTGLAQKWRRKYEVQGNDCLNTVVINAGDVEKIQYRHIKLAVWLLSAGLSTGLVFLFIEVVWLFTADSDLDDDGEDSSSSDSQSSGLNSNNSSSEQMYSSDDNDDIGRNLKFSQRVAKITRRSFNRQFISSRLSLTLRQTRLTEKVGCSPALAAVNQLNAASMTQVVSNGEVATTKSSSQLPTRRAERRARRLRRALDMVRRLHEGKLYSDFFLKVSNRVQSRVRRASLALSKLPSTTTRESAQVTAGNFSSVSAAVAAIGPISSSSNRTIARQRPKRRNEAGGSLEGPIRRRRRLTGPTSTLSGRELLSTARVRAQGTGKLV